MKHIKSTWPANWGPALETLCKFYNVRAHAASTTTVILLTAGGEPFARVSSSIALTDLKLALPLLLDTFELGTLNGEHRMKARMRDLLRADPTLRIPDEQN
jgi:hypothetical protein